MKRHQLQNLKEKIPISDTRVLVSKVKNMVKHAKNSTVVERPAELRALLARRAERNADLANIVTDAAR